MEKSEKEPAYKVVLDYEWFYTAAADTHVGGMSPRVNLIALNEALRDIIPGASPRQALDQVGFFGVNPNSAGQVEYASNSAGWNTRLVDYRTTYAVGLRSRNAKLGVDPPPVKTLAPWITFYLGALHQATPVVKRGVALDVTLVGGDFLVAPALARLAKRGDTRTRLVTISSRLDRRWESLDLSGIEVVDLENSPWMGPVLGSPKESPPPFEGALDFV